MNIDPGQINQMLGKIPFPIGKDDLIKLAQQHGVNSQVMGILQQNLPNQMFKSLQDVQNSLGSLGNLGNPGGGFKS